MNTIKIIGYAMVLFLFSALKPTSACEYAGSNINFVKTQTEKALSKDDLKLVRYYTFKALNAIENSKKQLNACKCEYASIGVEESAYLLKRASRLNDVEGAKDLIKRALDNIISSINSLEVHEEKHTRKKTDKLLALNDSTEGENASISEANKPVSYQKRIDTSLEKYRESLDKVVRTVNCKEAREFAEKIYKTCEQQLLKDGLSEQKQYFNLKTKKITADALVRINAKCDK